jgi:hypothetical protein
VVSELPPSSRPLTIPPELTVGNLVGTPMVGAIDWFIKKYGAAAGHDVVAKMPVRWVGWLKPHAPALGILGAKKYPYAFCGDLVRTALLVARIGDEDSFIREFAAAGIDASVGTVARILLRYAASPEVLAGRAQEAWNIFHDAGRVAVHVTEHEYQTTITDWTNHDVMVCRISMEVRRRLIERSGRKVTESRRDRCVAWGHPDCVVRVRW